MSVGPGHAAVGFHVTPGETGSPAFKSASKACQGILPGPTNTPAEQQAHKQDLLAFARCVRGHGIGGFPDPNLQGRLTLQMVSAAGIDIRSRTVLDAVNACVGASNGVISRADVQAAINNAR